MNGNGKLLVFFLILFSPNAFAFKDLQKCTSLLSRIFEKGISPGNSIGFHGTSLEALQQARLDGYLNARQEGNSKKWYFFPNLEHPKIQELIREKKIEVKEGILPEEITEDPRNQAWEGAKQYADIIARRHRFLKTLKLDIEIYDDLVLGMTFPRKTNKKMLQKLGRYDEAIYERFRKLGISDRQVDAAAEKAGEARGVILAISPKAPDKLKTENADGVDEGLRFSHPKGIDLKFIIGIEPLGDEEYQFFEALQREAEVLLSR